MELETLLPEQLDDFGVDLTLTLGLEIDIHPVAKRQLHYEKGDRDDP